MTLRSRLANHPAFAVLQRKFAAELPAKVEAIETAAAAVTRCPQDAAQAQSLFQQTHRLAGSSAIYGYGGLSRAAAELEQWLSAATPLAAVQLPPDLSPLGPLVRRLRDELAAGPDRA